MDDSSRFHNVHGYPTIHVKPSPPSLPYHLFSHLLDHQRTIEAANRRTIETLLQNETSTWPRTAPTLHSCVPPLSKRMNSCFLSGGSGQLGISEISQLIGNLASELGQWSLIPGRTPPPQIAVPQHARFNQHPGSPNNPSAIKLISDILPLSSRGTCLGHTAESGAPAPYTSRGRQASGDTPSPTSITWHNSLRVGSAPYTTPRSCLCGGRSEVGYRRPPLSISSSGLG